jgi:hypothetical protein
MPRAGMRADSHMPAFFSFTNLQGRQLVRCPEPGGSQKQRLEGAARLEEDGAGEQLGEDAAEAPDVDPRVVARSQHDLGRAVRAALQHDR